MKPSPLLFAAILAFISFQEAKSDILKCNYKTETDWWAINDVYYCDQLRIIEEETKMGFVTNITGTHYEGHSNSSVLGFRNQNHKLERIPKGLGYFFKNLEFIAIWDCGLKEVFTEDLVSFPNLRVLSFWKNKVEYLPREIFKFNTQIEYIGLAGNGIKAIGGKIFDQLTKLHTLHFDNNQCVSRHAEGDDVWDLVEEINEKCIK